MALSVATAAKSLAKYCNLVVARCVPTMKKDTYRFCITRLKFDELVNMYFDHNVYVYAHDEHKVCKTGDLVLLHKLPNRMTRLVHYEVLKVIYPLGDVTDPISGKTCTAEGYRDVMKMVDEAYGGNPKGFDYEKAPPRGWQEDIRDITARVTYTKNYSTDDPYSI